MEWTKRDLYRPEYEYVSTNQHGDRYKRKISKKFSIAVLSTDMTNTLDMRTLILLSHHLDAPVRYNFSSDPQQAYIEVISKEQLCK